MAYLASSNLLNIEEYKCCRRIKPKLYYRNMKFVYLLAIVAVAFAVCVVGKPLSNRTEALPLLRIPGETGDQDFEGEFSMPPFPMGPRPGHHGHRGHRRPGCHKGGHGHGDNGEFGVTDNYFAPP